MPRSVPVCCTHIAFLRCRRMTWRLNGAAFLPIQFVQRGLRHTWFKRMRLVDRHTAYHTGGGTAPFLPHTLPATTCLPALMRRRFPHPGRKLSKLAGGWRGRPPYPPPRPHPHYAPTPYSRTPLPTPPATPLLRLFAARHKHRLPASPHLPAPSAARHRLRAHLPWTLPCTLRHLCWTLPAWFWRHARAPCCAAYRALPLPLPAPPPSPLATCTPHVPFSAYAEHCTSFGGGEPPARRTFTNRRMRRMPARRRCGRPRQHRYASVLEFDHLYSTAHALQTPSWLLTVTHGRRTTPRAHAWPHIPTRAPHAH